MKNDNGQHVLDQASGLDQEKYKQLIEAAFHHTLGALGEVSFRTQQVVQVYTGDLPDIDSLLLRTDRCLEAVAAVIPVLEKLKAGCLHVRKEKGGRIDE